MPATKCTDTHKFCPRCGETKPHEEFHYSPKNKSRFGLSWACRPCVLEYQRERYRRHGKDSINDSYYRSIERRYGISREEYDRMFVEQGGKCAICNEDPSTFTDKSTRSRRLHVDHWHDDLYSVRGLLCHQCNFGVGFWQDDPTILRSAIKYLERHWHKRADEYRRAS